MGYTIDEGAQVGHVHLKVSDLERSIAFYRDVLGFELVTRIGDQAAFLSAGGYHHHVGLNTWMSAGGKRPAPGARYSSTLGRSTWPACCVRRRPEPRCPRQSGSRRLRPRPECTWHPGLVSAVWSL